MSQKKEAALNEVITEFQQFADKILEQLSILNEAMELEDVAIPEEKMTLMKANEKKINEFDVDISQKIADLIVLYNPMASDLRKILAIYRIAINLERIGDLAIGIIKNISHIKSPEIYKQMAEAIQQMLEYSINMVEKSLLSFFNSDREFAIWTIKNDEIVDEMNHKLLKKAIKKSEMPLEIQNSLISFITLKNIITNIERIADHATNIAEASIYSLEGKDIRHHQKDIE